MEAVIKKCRLEVERMKAERDTKEMEMEELKVFSE